MITKDIARLAIVRGAILLGHFDDIDHQKFFVVIGENENQLIGFFFQYSQLYKTKTSTARDANAYQEITVPLLKI